MYQEYNCWYWKTGLHVENQSNSLGTRCTKKKKSVKQVYAQKKICKTNSFFLQLESKLIVKKEFWRLTYNFDMFVKIEVSKSEFHNKLEKKLISSAHSTELK